MPGKPIEILGAPTRFGRVDYKLVASGNRLVATISLAAGLKAPGQIQASFRIPNDRSLVNITANGKQSTLIGRNKDAALIATNGQRQFEVVAQIS